MGCEEIKEKIENKIERLILRQNSILQQIEKEKKILESIRIDEIINEQNNNNKQTNSNYYSSRLNKNKISKQPILRFSSSETKVQSSKNNDKHYYKDKNDYLSIAIVDERRYERYRAMAPLENIQDFDYDELSNE